MAEDPRRILDKGAQARAACHLLPKGASAVAGTLVRVERGGVVVSVPLRTIPNGVDVRAWVPLDPDTWTFHATVLRNRLSVPDRSQEGLLLGYIDRFSREEGAGAMSGRRLDLIPSSGRGVSLLRPPARVVQLGLDGLTFTLPAASKLVFVENAEMQVVLADRAVGVCAARARVRGLARVDSALLYDLEWLDVDDAARIRVLVRVLSSGL